MFDGLTKSRVFEVLRIRVLLYLSPLLKKTKKPHKQTTTKKKNEITFEIAFYKEEINIFLYLC